MSIIKAINYAEKNRNRFLQELKDLVSIPSISSDSNHIPDMKECALFVKNAMSSIRFDRVEMIEIPGHGWFVACQFHPEFNSSPRDCHPLFRGFIEAANQHAERPDDEMSIEAAAS